MKNKKSGTNFVYPRKVTMRLALDAYENQLIGAERSLRNPPAGVCDYRELRQDAVNARRRVKLSTKVLFKEGVKWN